MKRSKADSGNHGPHESTDKPTSRVAGGRACFPSICGDDSSEQSEASSMTTPSDTAEFFFTSESATIPKGAHSILNREMNKLSIEERDKVYDDIHGVGDEVKEDDKLIAQKLSEFEAEIRRHTHIEGDGGETEQRHNQNLSSFAAAYVKAEEQSKEFVQDHKRRLAFLRADALDAKRAAIRYMKFFEEKLKLFGPEKLTKLITLSDMNDGDMDHLRKGSVQLLPARDRAGRAVIFGNFCECVKGNVYHLMRMAFMVSEAETVDEETQKKGIILVYFCIGKPIAINANVRRILWGCIKLVSILPARVSAIHFCSDDKVAGTIVPLIMLASGNHGRARARFHNGTQQECRFALMTFGVPVDLLPFSNEQTTKLKNHWNWIERQKEKETFTVGVDLISQNDVLLGRGKPFQNHPGNQRFRYLIATHKEEYQNAARKKDKITLTHSIVEKIKNNSGRFLEQKGNKKTNIGWWYEVPDSVARDKVSHAFRSPYTVMPKL